MELAIVIAVIWVFSIWTAYTLGKGRGINLGYREAREIDQLASAYQNSQGGLDP